MPAHSTGVQREAETVHASLCLVIQDGFLLQHFVETRVRVGPGKQIEGGI